MRTDVPSAELVKLAANAFLSRASASSTRSPTCASSSARTSSTSRAASGSTTGSVRISCAPGSASAGAVSQGRHRVEAARATGYRLLLQAVLEVNELQKRHVIGEFAKHLGAPGRKVALLGLAFKPNTDDMRGAEPRGRRPPARGRSGGPRVGSGRPPRRPPGRRACDTCSTRCATPCRGDRARVAGAALAGLRPRFARRWRASDRRQAQPARPGDRARRGVVYEAVGRPRHASPAEPAGVSEVGAELHR